MAGARRHGSPGHGRARNAPCYEDVPATARLHSPTPGHADPRAGDGHHTGRRRLAWRTCGPSAGPGRAPAGRSDTAEQLHGGDHAEPLAIADHRWSTAFTTFRHPTGSWVVDSRTTCPPLPTTGHWMPRVTSGDAPRNPLLLDHLRHAAAVCGPGATLQSARPASGLLRRATSAGHAAADGRGRRVAAARGASRDECPLENNTYVFGHDWWRYASPPIATPSKQQIGESSLKAQRAIMQRRVQTMTARVGSQRERFSDDTILSTHTPSPCLDRHVEKLASLPRAPARVRAGSTSRSGWRRRYSRSSSADRLVCSRRASGAPCRNVS